VLSPTSEERTSPVGDLYMLLAAVIFLELGGLGHLASAVHRSYEAVPIGVASASGLRGAATLVTVASAKLIASAVGLAAPVIVSMLLADLVLGVIARAAPQIPIYFTAMPLKALLGVGAVLIGLAALDAALLAGFRAWMALVERAFQVWRP
jgi:flagellar biosynthesis protein FliR